MTDYQVAMIVGEELHSEDGAFACLDVDGFVLERFGTFREVFRSMCFSTITPRSYHIASRLALWMIVVAGFVASNSVPAQAEMIWPVVADCTEHTLWSLEEAGQPIEQLLGNSYQTWNGCGAGASKSVLGDTDRPRVPAESPSVPSDPTPHETPLLGLGILGPSTGAGSDSGSSNHGGGSSGASAMLSWILELSLPTLVGYLDTVEALDIPPAPPFELLRPPQVITILVRVG